MSQFASAQSDLAHERRRLAYAMRQVIEMRKRIPAATWETAAPGVPAKPEKSDLLVRLFAALRPI